MYPCLFLVVPDSEYHKHVPLLIGTNLLEEILKDAQQQYGNRFLQNACLKTPFYLTFKCIALRDKELQRQHNRWALVKSTETASITIPANSEVAIK